MNESRQARITRSRGVTLIELMVVVAIIGVLAAIGGMSYVKYIKQGKTTQLKQYAMEVEKAQKDYASRNGDYFNPEDASSVSSNAYTNGYDTWESVLGFTSKEAKNNTIEIRTEAGGPSDNCGLSECPGNFEKKWYAIQVTQDMDPESTEKTTVYLDSTMPQPIVSNEGE
jgi:type IV pilus assembly protein PilE